MKVNVENLGSLLDGPLEPELIDKLRCLVERKIPVLAEEIKKSHADHAATLATKLLANMANRLLQDNAIDLPLLNCCLNLQEVCAKLGPQGDSAKLLRQAKGEVSAAIKALSQKKGTLEKFQSELHLVREETIPATGDFSVTVFSQHDRSLAAAYIMTHLIKNGIKISLVVTQKRFSKGAVRQEFHLGMYRTLRRRFTKAAEKIKRKIIPEKGYTEIRDVAASEGISNDVQGLCEANGIPVVYVQGFNSQECHQALSEHPTEFGLYLGKQIVKKSTIRHFSTGVVHSHPGRIPLYRGMDCVEWALIQEERSHIGSSVQLMTPKLDAGPVLDFETLPTQPGWSVNVIRSRVLYQGISKVINFFTNITESECLCRYYDPTYGRQYYRMRPEIRRNIET